jgi:hypothetical protein
VAICHKCLNGRPSDRYADASQLADDLERFRRHRPTKARPIGHAERCFLFYRRNTPALWTAAAFLVIATMATLGWTNASLNEMLRRQQEQRTIEEREKNETARYQKSLLDVREHSRHRRYSELREWTVGRAFPERDG